MNFVSRWLFVLLLSAGVLAGCGENDQAEQQAESNEEEIGIEIELSKDKGEETISEEEYMVEEGTTLMEIMENNYEIKEEGGFINSIDGIQAKEGEQKAWLYTINGEDATVGANEYEVEDGDEINFDFQAWE
ncbi:DUF4430 domain-containing protein [Halobacillus sp. Marseille-Q1614]|uniref:DUF4430 domain-containing protein n=1 Tax=Halobacillus sp. Marseille-Q1614 TaxID=2709134 RepID=UPI0015705435|nr:DUF4430 domain-containing protein [Halobacillus sp. Marseille-Q1614]